MTTEIQKLITNFATTLDDAIQQIASEKVMAAIRGTLGVAAQRTPSAKPAKSRRKGPIQLCPVPRCSNRAAPIYSMVCAKHKDLPKATIKKFRETRRTRAKKAGK